MDTIDKYLETQKQRQGVSKSKSKSMSLARAQKIWEEAQEFPRCGQDWGRYPEERQAEKIMKAALAAMGI